MTPRPRSTNPQREHQLDEQKAAAVEWCIADGNGCKAAVSHDQAKPEAECRWPDLTKVMIDCVIKLHMDDVNRGHLVLTEKEELNLARLLNPWVPRAGR